MKNVNGLTISSVLLLSICFVHSARGGTEVISQPRPAPALEQLSGTPGVTTTAGGVGQRCDDIINTCFEPLVCVDETCREACQNDGDCDDGLKCTIDSCGGCTPDPEGEVCVCNHTYNDAACGHYRDTHLIALDFNVFDARSVGIWGECFDEAIGPTVPDEECVFTVEAVQYFNPDQDFLQGHTKFNAVCVDLYSTHDVLTCSPMERESVEIGVQPSVAVQIGGSGGIAAGVDAEGKVGVDVGVGVSFPITVHRKFKYPQWRRFTGTVGGNILIDSGVGSLFATESVIFSHSQYEGEVRFIVTKPKGMKLYRGYKKFLDETRCLDTDGLTTCPVFFADALETAANLLLSAAAVASSTDGTTAAAFQSDFDLEELKEALDDEKQAIDDITNEIKDRLEQKIKNVFDIMKGYLYPSGENASVASRSVLVDEMMNLLRDRITESLQEIRDIVKELVLCPE